MKTYFLIAISLICIKANAQKDSIPVFKNQGEQEDFWAKEIFRKEYKKEDGANASGIRNIIELPFPELPPTIKRFSCWISWKGFANPVVYVFELTNEQATKQTDLKSFIMGASLTFTKQGTIII